MIYYLAIDGGGTKTRVLCADENGEVVGEGLSGPTSLTVSNLGAASFALREGIRQATQNLPPGFVIKKLVMGLAGIDTEVEKEKTQEAFKHVLSDFQIEEFMFMNDIYIALRTASDSNDALAIISGTGSNCFGLNSEGKTHKTGGLDYIISDQGSGYAIGLGVLQMAAKSFDGRIATSKLEQKVNAYFQTASIPDLKQSVYNPVLSKMQIAALAKLAFEAMAEGDIAAKYIIDKAAEELFLMAKIVIERLGLNSKQAECVFAGKVLLNDYMKQYVSGKLSQAFPSVKIVIPTQDPVHGALKIALQKQ
jgi:N-acetylglucosamine kinase-like BadF-type ATPase